MNQRIPYCPHCRPDLGLKGVSVATDAVGDNTTPSSSTIHGVMKPDIVFFGEGLPTEFHASLQEDVKKVDLVLVMGSSLKVRPVSHIPGEFLHVYTMVLVLGRIFYGVFVFWCYYISFVFM